MPSGCPMNANTKLFGIDESEWNAAYDNNVRVYPATRFVVVADGASLRLSFGTSGRPTDESVGRGAPVYHAAIVMDANTAIALRNSLNDLIREVRIENESGAAT